MTQSSGPNRRALLGGASMLAASAIMPASAQAEKETPAINVGGKSILITGTSSGFGKLASLHLARHGAVVIASMRNFQKGKRAEAQELRDIASDEKLNLSVVEIDVTDPALVTSGVKTAEQTAKGKLDVLVSNAGLALAGPIEMQDEEALMKQFQTNLFGSQRMANAVLPNMRARKQGQIIQISSQLGRMIIPNIGMYSATKFGVEAMFESMAYELAPHGVDVTIIQPGGYPTKIWDNGRRYFTELQERTNDELKNGYAVHLQLAQGLLQGGGSTDPMDVPHAIAEIVSMPAGARPLRRPVHPNTRGSSAANAAMAQIQASVLGAGPYASWHKSVTD